MRWGDWQFAVKRAAIRLTLWCIEALRRAVQGLPRRYREVVVLCDLEEVDYAEAAVILGCPIGTVRSRMHRARALLLDKLNQDRKPRMAVDTWKPVRCAI